MPQQPLFSSSSSSFIIQGLGIGISTLYPVTFSECNSHKSWHLWDKIQKDKTHSENIVKISRVFVMVYFVFFCSSFGTTVSPLLLCSNCLTFLLNIFSTIYEELFFMSILTNFARLPNKSVREFFWKSCRLTASKFAEVEPGIKCLPWNYWIAIIWNPCK